MTKVMKFHITFDGNYGGSVDEYTLLPIDINGKLFPFIEEGYVDEIGLGEIEGKHSYAEGDLNLEIIDLEKMSLRDVSKLIEESYFNYIEGYFETATEDFMDEDEEESYSQEKEIEVRKRYNISDDVSWGLIDKVHDGFIKELKEKYVQRFEEISVLERDFIIAKALLNDAGIKTY